MFSRTNLLISGSTNKWSRPSSTSQMPQYPWILPLLRVLCTCLDRIFVGFTLCKHSRVLSPCRAASSQETHPYHPTLGSHKAPIRPQTVYPPQVLCSPQARTFCKEDRLPASCLHFLSLHDSSTQIHPIAIFIFFFYLFF